MRAWYRRTAVVAYAPYDHSVPMCVRSTWHVCGPEAGACSGELGMRQAGRHVGCVACEDVVGMLGAQRVCWAHAARCEHSECTIEK
jgi:hypothetical protein